MVYQMPNNRERGVPGRAIFRVLIVCSAFWVSVIVGWFAHLPVAK